MIRIILRESKYGISDRDYGLKHVRFLKKIYRLASAVINIAKEELAPEEDWTNITDEEWNRLAPQLEKYQNSLWLNIIQQIKPLRTEHIAKVVGFGRLGGAFLLTNGNILKVGLDSDGDGPELDWLINSHIPQQLKSRHFGGHHGTANELHVYDSGDIDIGDGGLWSWREVPRYTTFLDWLDQKNLSGADEIAYLGQEVNDILSSYSRQLDRTPGFLPLYKLIMKTKINDYSLLTQLEEDESRKLIKAMYDIILHRKNLKDNDVLDLKAENLGVDQRGNFVFFDF